MSTMSDLVVLAYADEHRASEVMATLHRLRTTASADGVDAVCMVRRNDWTVTLNREEELVAPDDGSVGFWRSLISSLILIPGGASLRSKVTEFGIEPGFEVTPEGNLRQARRRFARGGCSARPSAPSDPTATPLQRINRRGLTRLV